MRGAIVFLVELAKYVSGGYVSPLAVTSAQSCFVSGLTSLYIAGLF